MKHPLNFNTGEYEDDFAWMLILLHCYQAEVACKGLSSCVKFLLGLTFQI